MFVALIAILYKLITRFPALVLLMYSVYMFEGTLIEKEAREVQEVEVVELVASSDDNQDSINDQEDFLVKRSVFSYKENHISKEESQFVQTSHLKLYILYSRLLIEERRPNFGLS